MSLSIGDAALDQASAAGLLVEGEALSFGELAERVAVAGRGQERVIPIEARPDVESIVRLLAALQAGRPAVLLHPALGPAERTRALEGLTDHAALGDSAVVVFTSGTSGRPRAVGLPAAALLAAARASWAHLGCLDDDRWLLALPFAHVGGLSVITRCLVARRPVVLAPAAGRRAGAFLATVERDRVTLASLVPTQLRRLLDETSGWRPPAHLRAVLVGGAAAPAGLLPEARARGWPVVATYGLSETAAQVATGRLEEPPDAGAWPLPGVALRIVGGEIQVRGPTLMSGYLPVGTHGSPFTADGWLGTGDLGELDDAGRLQVRGRRDDRLKTGGELVDPLEVERVLEGHASVAEAGVFGVPDPLWGQRVAAALVLRAGHALDPADLAGHLAAHLAAFKRPRAVAVLVTLPVGATGKLDRRTLSRVAAAGLQALPPAP